MNTEVQVSVCCLCKCPIIAESNEAAARSLGKETATVAVPHHGRYIHQRKQSTGCTSSTNTVSTLTVLSVLTSAVPVSLHVYLKYSTIDSTRWVNATQNTSTIIAPAAPAAAVPITTARSTR